ncbi:PREDICTED: uncharacterized protein LOC106104365 [Papilio polytes]|uniref:uncharacterized protein LOC106104365 n=1 Tax=Papilio polytes TaxID=76194 RepID=UPI0006768CF7|nr:PREDICTED: uncharacterized protein LOC106104365 [Papilio polytes]
MEKCKLGTCTKCVRKEVNVELEREVVACGAASGGAGPEAWRRQCGCVRTSDKLRRIIEQFPCAPPPSPADKGTSQFHKTDTCISAFCSVHQNAFPTCEQRADDSIECATMVKDKEIEQQPSRPFGVVTDIVQLLQLSVTATALALYYLIYCYMQLVYYTLRSALYFHNADGPMKITIGVVTLTSLIVGFNLLVRLERLLFIFN